MTRKFGALQVENLGNLMLMALCLLILLFFWGDDNFFTRQETLFQLSSQSYSERLAYSRLLDELSKERAVPDQIRYIPPPTIVSLTSMSNQFVFGTGTVPIFSPKEELVVEGLAAPKSLVWIFFDPKGGEFSAFSDSAGVFRVIIPSETLKSGRFEVSVEGEVNQVSTGKIKRMDMLLRIPWERDTVFAVGSMIALMLAILLGKMLLGGSVKLVRE